MSSPHVFPPNNSYYILNEQYPTRQTVLQESPQHHNDQLFSNATQMIPPSIENNTIYSQDFNPAVYFFLLN